MLLRILVALPFVFCACVPDGPPGGAAASASASETSRPRATIKPKPRPAPRSITPPGTPAAPRSAAKRERPPDPFLTEPFVDRFDRSELGNDWIATSARWRLRDGRLCGEGARNHPVWLKRRLPVNARIEFDAESASEDGDIKAEYWGDGRSAARGVSYDHATSYLTIFGGWKNHFHVLARQDEHAKNRPEVAVSAGSDDPRARPVAMGQTYHFKVERNDGKTVRWYVDDIEILKYTDPSPLAGPGHEHFGFNDWTVPVCFDNLEITPLK